jgi:hypothetical protein
MTHDLQTLWTLVSSHPIIVWFILAVMIDKLPKPTGKNAFYCWFFAVAQTLAANFSRAKRGVTGDWSVPTGT